MGKKTGSKRALKGVMEYKEYADQLSDDDLEWVKQFYDEFHGGNHSVYDEPILTTSGQIKEANRNYNNLYHDAFAVSNTLHKQVEISPDDREVYELATDELEWETVVNRYGYEVGADLIMMQTLNALDTSKDKKVVLSRFYVKMNKLFRLKNTEKRKQR